MKIWYLILILFTIPNPIFAAFWYDKIETLKDLDLKGPVKRVVLQDYCEPVNEDGSWVPHVGRCYCEAEFSKAGYLTSLIGKGVREIEDEHSEYVYLNDSLPIYIAKFQYNTKWEYTISYDSLNRLKEIRFSLNSELQEIYLFEYNLNRINITVNIGINTIYARNTYHIELYDNLGRLIEEQKLNEKGSKAIHTTKYTYDNFTNIVSKVVWDKSAAHPKTSNEYEYHWFFYEYNTSGAISVHSEYINKEKKPKYLEENFYNSKNLCVFHRITNEYESGWTIYDSLFYNENDLVIEQHFFVSGKKNRIWYYSYDQDGNLIAAKQKLWDPFNPNSEETNYYLTLKVDDYGNWIEMTYPGHKNIERVATREITYYE